RPTGRPRPPETRHSPVAKSGDPVLAPHLADRATDLNARTGITGTHASSVSRPSILAPIRLEHGHLLIVHQAKREPGRTSSSDPVHRSSRHERHVSLPASASTAGRSTFRKHVRVAFVARSIRKGTRPRGRIET